MWPFAKAVQCSSNVWSLLALKHFIDGCDPTNESCWQVLIRDFYPRVKNWKKNWKFSSYRSSSFVVVQIHQRPTGCSRFLYTFLLNSISKLCAKSDSIRNVITTPSPQPILVFQFHLWCPSTTTDFWQFSDTTGLSHTVGYSSRSQRIRVRWFLCSCVNNPNRLWINILLITDYLECRHSILLVCLLSGHLRLPP